MHLENYLTRLGLAQPLPPTLETLRRTHVAHLAAFTFDNLAIQRRERVRVDLDSVTRKFLAGGAPGGYCFEQNTLLGAMLRELGFDVTTLLGRVGTPALPNHMLLRVTIDGEPWLADVGFGGEGPLEPIPLADGARVTQDGIDYSLRRDGDEWTLTMHYAGATMDLFAFTDAPHGDDAVAASNELVSEHPDSIFRKTITIQRVTPEERVILRPKVVTRYVNGVRTDTPIEPSEVRRYARELFGIDLGEDALLFEEAESEQNDGVQ